MQVSLIILAAGMGTRMNSDVPKVLHHLAAAPLLHHALAASRSLEPSRIIVVAGHEADLVKKAAQDFDDTIETVIQEPQLGTAHAVLAAAPLLAETAGETIVLYGDTPFVRAETVQAMLEARQTNDVIVLGFEPADPGRYGRLIVDADQVVRIVEYKDATDEELAVTICNSGVICASTQTLLQLASKVGTANAAQEFYLTDIVEIARGQGLTVGYVTCAESETLGINTRADLSRAEATFQHRARVDALENGVTLTAPDTVFFALDTFIGRDAIVGPNVIFGPGVTIESGAEIKGFCHLEGCHISRGAVVGPFARLRPGAELAEDVHVGNFVEIKNTVLEEGVKVGHLTYLGDAHVGEFTNIGAGTVTCNYDGVMKHHTEIGKRVFIGSDTMLVAPVAIGDDAMTASGSVITRDVPAGALAIARARQDTKPGLATLFMARLRAIKANTHKGL